ncbi:hypothetical protein ACJX0J_018603, partial [Zea mays]
IIGLGVIFLLRDYDSYKFICHFVLSFILPKHMPFRDTNDAVRARSSSCLHNA